MDRSNLGVEIWLKQETWIINNKKWVYVLTTSIQYFNKSFQNNYKFHNDDEIFSSDTVKRPKWIFLPVNLNTKGVK